MASISYDIFLFSDQWARTQFCRLGGCLVNTLKKFIQVVLVFLNLFLFLSFFSIFLLFRFLFTSLQCCDGFVSLVMRNSALSLYKMMDVSSDGLMTGKKSTKFCISFL